LTPAFFGQLLDALGGRDQVTGLGEALKQTGLGEESNVGRVAAVHFHLDLGFELTTALVLDLDSGAVDELLPGTFQPFGLDVPDGSVDRDGAADVLPLL